MITPFVKSPLLHVPLLGVLVAVVLIVLHGPPVTQVEARRIVVGDGDVEQLRRAWQRKWQRPPTDLELRAMLEDAVREEVLYREAVSRGLDRGDTIVRRTMARKMDFLGEAQAAADQPTDEEVRAYFALRTERYREPPKVSFVHVYFSMDRRADRAEQDARAALATLADRELDFDGLAGLGDPFPLRGHYAGQTERDVRSQFGEAFARAVLAAEPDQWTGPVQSGYGVHLVHVYDRDESRVPDWTEVRDRVARDMVFEAKNAAREQFYQEVLRGYRIVPEGEAREVLAAGDR